MCRGCAEEEDCKGQRGGLVLGMKSGEAVEARGQEDEAGHAMGPHVDCNT